jgi:hypothetical protein
VELSVNRDEAERALGIIRNVIQNTREDLVAHNWGTIWMVHSFVNLAACLAGWYVQTRELGVFWYLVPLAICALLNIVIVAALLKRDQGVRSYVEWQIHGIWTTYIIFTLAGAFVLMMTDADPKLFGPLFALTSGIGFAMMWVVFGRQLPSALAMLVVTLLSPFVSAWQWPMIGVVWWGAMFFPGLSMYRENRRRNQEAHATQLL